MRHSPTRFIITALWISCALAASVASAADDLDPLIGADALKKITAALPGSAAAKPARPRKVLVFTESARDLAAIINAERIRRERMVDEIQPILASFGTSGASSDRKD